jgi:hypothetical protein
VTNLVTNDVQKCQHGMQEKRKKKKEKKKKRKKEKKKKRKKEWKAETLKTKKRLLVLFGSIWWV